jgi:hypothetical protein
MSDSAPTLAFETLDDQHGVEIVDRVEQERCLIRTSEPISPEPAGEQGFRFPVDRAMRLRVTEMSLPNVAGMFVRDDSGEIIQQIQRPAEEQLPRDSYDLELITQFKTYLQVTSEFEVVSDASKFRIDFDSATDIIVGARGNHERPTTTITTTDAPIDMMAAIETFGSALKTMAPDRSLPSLRGHPPSVKLGDSLDVPSSLERAASGIRLELPARREAVYVAAPLAYYLGAEVEPGPTPKLVTETGFEHSLSGQFGFETAVERTLKQVFFLDCVTRTEGLYKLDLHERTEVEQLIDLDFADLYEQSLAAQVAAYLEIPYEVLAEHIPDWRLTTHVEAVPETIEQLPFVVDDLAVVRTNTSGAAVSNGPMVPDAPTDEVLTRSADGKSSSGSAEYVEPRASDSLEQAWIGEDIPIGASKLTREAFDNRLDRAPIEGDISITIVLNDSRMDEERDLVDQAYGNRESLPFEIDVRRDVAVEELREILQEDIAFLHYIGHTEADGFECPDGKLDARTLEHTGVQAFLLNACNSYEQGLGLIEAGGVGGIVTLNDVINEGAVRIGETVARLLNTGFPLRGALTIARDESVLGGQYIVVGDGGMTVAQPASGTPYLMELERASAGGYDAEIETYTTDVTGLGTMFIPYTNDDEEYYLSSGSIASFHMTEAELLQYLQMENFPVRIDGELYFSKSLELGDLL